LQKPTRAKIGPLGTPATPVVKPGPLTGQAEAKTRAIYGGYTYNWQACLASAPTVVVRTLQTTSARAILPGLTPGELYNVEVCALGAAGPSNWSDPGKIRVV
jgi:hypothetical protein